MSDFVRLDLVEGVLVLPLLLTNYVLIKIPIGTDDQAHIEANQVKSSEETA